MTDFKVLHSLDTLCISGLKSQYAVGEMRGALCFMDVLRAAEMVAMILMFHGCPEGRGACREDPQDSWMI
jgi:hypothetical protein